MEWILTIFLAIFWLPLAAAILVLPILLLVATCHALAASVPVFVATFCKTLKELLLAVKEDLGF